MILKYGNTEIVSSPFFSPAGGAAPQVPKRVGLWGPPDINERLACLPFLMVPPGPEIFLDLPKGRLLMGPMHFFAFWGGAGWGLWLGGKFPLPPPPTLKPPLLDKMQPGGRFGASG